MACVSSAASFLFEFVSSGPEVSRRDNMDYPDISLTLPLRLSTLPRVASWSQGAVSWNQVSLFDRWRVTLLFPLRWLLRNIHSRVFISRPVSRHPHNPLPQSLQPLRKQKLFHGWAYHFKSFCRWRQSLLLNHLRRIAVVFTRKVRGTWHPKSTESLSHCCYSDLCPLHPSEDLVRLLTHMLITNLYAFFMLLLNTPFSF